MNEEKLINQIKELKTITPESGWVLANKKELLGEERNLDWSVFLKPALVGASAFAIFLAFNLSQDALPGDILFTLKKIREEQNILNNDTKPVRNFKLANKRLDELSLIVETNEVEKISPAINEFQEKIKDITEDLSEAYLTNQEIDEGLIEEANKLELEKERVEKVLATKGLEGEVWDDYKIAKAKAEIRAAENHIGRLKLFDLNEEDNERLSGMEQDLEQAKEYLEKENYEPVYEIINRVWEEIINLSKEKQIKI